jgi:hypothetical protein
MDSAVGKSENGPDTPALPGNPVTGAVRSAMDDRVSRHAAVQAEALSGPAVLAQPPAGETDDAVARLRPDRVETPDRKAAAPKTGRRRPSSPAHSKSSIPGAAVSRRPPMRLRTEVRGKQSRSQCLGASSLECSSHDDCPGPGVITATACATWRCSGFCASRNRGSPRAGRRRGSSGCANDAWLIVVF